MSMKKEQKKSLIDFKIIETSILSMMGNPHCDSHTFKFLGKKLQKCRSKIEELIRPSSL